MICLDTNVVIGLVNGVDRRLRDRFEELDEFATISAIVYFEMRYGLAKSRLKQATGARLAAFVDNQVSVLNFDRADAAEAAEIRAGLERKGTPIGSYDLLIAAQARQRRVTLVTANTREFARVPGLMLQDWSVA